MRNFVVFSYLLSAATLMLLMNQQANLVEAKPFLLPSVNFFVLTTRAPCTSERTTNCNSNARPADSSSSSSSGGGVQTYNLLEPKLRFLSTLLQSFSRGVSSSGSASGGIKGGFGFSFNKFGGLAGASTTTTTTTTSSPDVTEPDSVFTPDSNESTTAATIASTSSQTTTTAGPDTSSTEDNNPGYSYENSQNGLSGSISVSAGTPAGSVNTLIALSNRLGEENETGEKEAQTNALNGQGQANESTTGTGYQYDNSNENSSTEDNSAYQYNQQTSSTEPGYQYGRPAENEVSR